MEFFAYFECTIFSCFHLLEEMFQNFHMVYCGSMSELLQNVDKDLQMILEITLQEQIQNKYEIENWS